MDRADKPEMETILVVEDEPELASILQRALMHRGYSVLTANNGEDALSVAENSESPIDLLISDIVMPGMGGRELVWRFRETRPQLKVILYSGYTDMSGAIQMMEEDGEITFLQKPVDLKDLVATVRQLLSVASA